MLWLAALPVVLILIGLSVKRTRRFHIWLGWRRLMRRTGPVHPRFDSRDARRIFHNIVTPPTSRRW